MTVQAMTKVFASLIAQHLRRAGMMSAVLSVVCVLACALLHPSAAFAIGAAARVKTQEAAAALLRGDLQVAVNAYTAALGDTNLDKDRRATILNDRAVALVRMRKMELAIQDYNQAVQLFPEYAVVYNNRGNLLLDLNLPHEAVKDFNRAIVLAPGYAEAYNNRAAAYVRLRNGRAAINDYTQAIRLMPSTPAPLSGRGRAHLALNQPHAAIRDFSRAVKADARFADGYRNRAEAKLDVAHYSEAIEDLSRAIAFDANNSELYVLRGHANLATENTSVALADFNKGVELAPNSASAYEARGLTYALTLETEAALEDLNRAVELNPRSAIAFAYRGFAYAQGDQAEVGARDIETALKLDDKSPEVIWAKGEVVLIAGNREEAIADFREAAGIDPSYRRASLALQRLGISDEVTVDTPVAGLGIEDWVVVTRAGRYYATSKKYRRIRVPLEMNGKGQPKLLQWALRDKPFKGIGTLRFSTGTVPDKNNKPVPTEATAIVDLWQATVVAVQPTRTGSKRAKWTWSNGAISVASVDGVMDEFRVRNGRNPAVAGRGRRGDYRRNAEGVWEPWAQGPRAGTRKSTRRKRRRRKSKTIFQLLFSN